MSNPVGHWEDLRQPPSLAQAMYAGQIVVDFFRGSHAEKVKAIYAAGEVQQFAVSQIPHEHPPMFGDASIEDPVAVLESALSPADDGSMKAVNWLLVLQAVKMILELLRNR